MKLRSFIAVEIPHEIQRSILRSTASLQKAFPKPVIRWVEAKNLHLTLKFLGDVSPEDLAQLAGELKVELLTHRSFTMSVAGLGMFPNSHKPKIIWVGLDAPIGLSILQQSVDNVASRVGFSPEDRPFLPHLTIGRVGQAVNQADMVTIRESVTSTTIGNLGMVQVEALHIFKSDLRPGGSVYTKLYSLPLTR